MIKHIGTTHSSFIKIDPSLLKRELMLFDRLAVVELDTYIQQLLSSSNVDANAQGNLLEWLVDEELLFNFNPWSAENIGLIDVELKCAIKHHEIVNVLEKKIDRWSEELEHDIYSLLNNVWQRDAYEARASAILINDHPSINAVATLPFNCFELSGFESAQSENAVRMVINKFPFLSGDVPLTEMLQLIKTEEFTSKKKALFRWMRKITTETNSPIEMEEELEYLLNEYTEYMRVQKLKFQYGVLEGILKGTSEVIENIIKFRLSKFVDSLFYVSKTKVALMEAELKAPGKEISLISYVNNMSSRGKI